MWLLSGCRQTICLCSKSEYGSVNRNLQSRVEKVFYRGTDAYETIAKCGNGSTVSCPARPTVRLCLSEQADPTGEPGAYDRLVHSSGAKRAAARA